MSGRSLWSGSGFDWRMTAAVGLWSVTGIAAAVLASRAWAGAFDVRVSAIVPGIVTALALVMSLGAAALFILSDEHRRSRQWSVGRRLGLALLSLVLPAMIAAATTVNASPFALGLVTGLLTLGLCGVIAFEGSRAADPSAVETRADPETTRGPESSSTEGTSAWNANSDEVTSSGLVQQFARRQAEDGSELIEAVLTAVFAPFERETVVHLPFQPALASTPHIECEPLDTSEVTATVTSARPYGVRIELRRETADERELAVPIGVEITSAASAARVA